MDGWKKTHFVVFVGTFHVVLDKLDISDGLLQFQRKAFGNATATLVEAAAVTTSSSHQ